MGCGASTPQTIQDPGGFVVADTRGLSKNATNPDPEEAEKDKAAALIQTAAAGAMESKAPAKEEPKAEPAAATPASVAPATAPAAAPAAGCRNAVSRRIMIYSTAIPVQYVRRYSS